jgi:hypothetical protein
MKSFLLFFAAAISISIISAAERRYPQDALECFASSALQSQKDGQIICPLGSNVCIKEIINATRAQCGKTNGLYLGRDVWDVRLAKCVYRKCGLTCPNTVETTFREENLKVESNATQIFSRTSHCCDTNLCNRADRRSGFLCGLVLVLSIYCFIAFAS